MQKRYACCRQTPSGDECKQLHFYFKYSSCVQPCSSRQDASLLLRLSCRPRPIKPLLLKHPTNFTRHWPVGGKPILATLTIASLKTIAQKWIMTLLPGYLSIQLQPARHLHKKRLARESKLAG